MIMVKDTCRFHSDKKEDKTILVSIQVKNQRVIKVQLLKKFSCLIHTPGPGRIMSFVADPADHAALAQ